MASKVFLESGSMQLVGDERDVMVPHRLQTQVMRWCWDNDIRCELNYQGSQERWLIQETFKMDLWKVPDEQQRVLFILRWS